MKLLNKKFFTLLSFGLLFMAMASPEVFAATATGLPWESPLDTLRNSISGPVAFTISIIAIIASGATLIWGGEISEFARKMIMVVLVIALIVAANAVLSGLFGTTSAVIS